MRGLTTLNHGLGWPNTCHWRLFGPSRGIPHQKGQITRASGCTPVTSRKMKPAFTLQSRPTHLPSGPDARVDDLEPRIGLAKHVPRAPIWSEQGHPAPKRANNKSKRLHSSHIQKNEAGIYPAIKAHPFAIRTRCEG